MKIETIHIEAKSRKLKGTWKLEEVQTVNIFNPHMFKSAKELMKIDRDADERVSILRFWKRLFG